MKISILAVSPTHQMVADFKIKSSAVARAEVIADLTERWCVSRAKEYLSAYKVSPFLLIVFNDLIVSKTSLMLLPGTG